MSFITNAFSSRSRRRNSMHRKTENECISAVVLQQILSVSTQLSSLYSQVKDLKDISNVPFASPHADVFSTDVIFICAYIYVHTLLKRIKYLQELIQTVTDTPCLWANKDSMRQLVESYSFIRLSGDEIFVLSLMKDEFINCLEESVGSNINEYYNEFMVDWAYKNLSILDEKNSVNAAQRVLTFARDEPMFRNMVENFMPCIIESGHIKILEKDTQILVRFVDFRKHM